jgi:hypothetical protein
VIFTKELGRLAAEGRKTQTRRPVRTTAEGVVRPCPWVPGRDYSIERPGGAQAHDVRIEVLNVQRGLLGDITLREVRAEGHRTTAAFADDWMRSHDRGWPPVENCEVCDGAGDQDCDDCFRYDAATDGLVGTHPPGCTTCGRCEGTGEQLAAVDDDLVLERFERHRHALVWIVSFRRSQAPRLLTPAARPAGSVHGYTSNPRNAMRDEPEVMDGPRARPYGLRAVDGAPTVDIVRSQARSLANRLRQDSVAAARTADPAAVLEHLGEVQRILGQVDQLRRDAAA